MSKSIFEEKEIEHHGNCPECNQSWDAGRIWKVWREMDLYKNKTDKQLQALEKKGYSKPYHFSKLLGVEVPEKYDGISYWQCPFCKSAWDRFTGKKEDKFKDLKK